MLTNFKKNPIHLAFSLLFLALLLRLNDIFILKIDERFGEIILSKTLGFLLILLFMLLVKESLSTIGLHKNYFGVCVCLGFLLNLILYLISYGLESLILLLLDQNPQITFTAIDPKQGIEGGFLFGIWLIFGNIINALMEESLFRGVFLPALKTRFRFWKANFIQALLFGAWHLVWPLKYYISGEQSLFGAFMYGIVLLLGTVTFGFIWGYMFEKTNSLWTAIAAHFAANTIQNILHIQSDSGVDTMLFLRGTFASLLGLISIFFIKWFATKLKLPTLSSWKIYSGS
jgi:membrane protease YdiL (CAAX protease family)